MSNYILVDDGTVIMIAKELAWHQPVPLYNVIDQTERLSEALTIVANLENEDDWDANGRGVVGVNGYRHDVTPLGES